MLEPEKIEILEGPTPDFRPNTQVWNWGIYDGMLPSSVVSCELRTNNGEAIRERCQRAWREGRPVLLEFPDEMRMRRHINVVAMRLHEVDEGTVLSLWVRQPFEESELIMDDEDETHFP